MSAKAPPPTSSLRPPTEGGASKYTAVIAFLAAGLLGLLVWKHFSGGRPVEQLPPLAPTSATPPPREEDIPPPPAPVEDSTPDASAPKSTTPSNWASCDAKTCSGSVTSDLESVLAFRAKAAHKCYDDALALDSTLKGTVKIAVRLAANGNLCAVNVASSDLSNPAVATCIANRFRQTAHFSAPSGGCLDVNVPISLMPPH